MFLSLVQITKSKNQFLKDLLDCGGGVLMILPYESLFYNTLEELQETYKPNHQDVIKLKSKYGNDIRISRIMHKKGVKPRFELSCYKIKLEV